eukprot:TRINITY_DN3349_c0_g1_i1.p2 TRINITY_DN3349_c0_g1~~TRINITY_DN3349_c0_g1_i1.p2  ORF type:complete len:100 (-),score=5.33 TRINITY_DN3349_c0_g1_i1:561-860(-)
MDVLSFEDSFKPETTEDAALTSREMIDEFESRLAHKVSTQRPQPAWRPHSARTRGIVRKPMSRITGVATAESKANIQRKRDQDSVKELDAFEAKLKGKA